MPGNSEVPEPRGAGAAAASSSALWPRASAARTGPPSGAPEHGARYSMTDLELPPSGPPSQQVRPRPRGPAVVPERGQGLGGAAAGYSFRLWQAPGLRRRRRRTAAAALAPGPGGEERRLRGCGRSGAAAGVRPTTCPRFPRATGLGVGDARARMGRRGDLSRVLAAAAGTWEPQPAARGEWPQRQQGRRGWTLAV